MRTAGARITSSLPTIRTLSAQTTSKRLSLLEICRIKRDLQLLADRNLASQFVEEVFEKDHLVLRLLSFCCLDGH
jgi:hypothetical protein